MRFKNELNPYFVSTFLNCHYGKKQSDKNIVGLSRPALDYNRVKGFFLIPIFPKSFQLEIEKIVKEAHEKQAKSKQLYQQAEQLLLTELDLLDYQPKNQLTFTITKNDIKQAQRFDAEYFQPKYADIIKKIENYSGGFDVVKNIFDWKKGIEVGSDAYTKTGKDFVRVSDVSINGVEISNRKISNALFAEIKDGFQPKKDEILFTKDGTIGISYLLKDNIDGVVSSAFLRLTLKDDYQNFEKEYFVLMFNSILCKLQVEQLSGGAIIAHLKPSDFEKIKIPLIKLSIQTQIADKITQSHILRKQSKQLLELAKLKVEQEIEKGTKKC
jgi:type I restriction enzyme S subunit